MPLYINGIVNPPPYAPTLLTPANATYEDVTGTPTFTWQYNPAQVGRTQSAWSFHRKISGAGSYQWWNSSTNAWQSTQVWNSGSVQTYTFPSAAWTDGNIYNWSVGTQDANGTGPMAADFTLNAQANPTVTVLTPGGTVTTAQPIVSWSNSLPTGALQTSFRVVIYNATQYGAGGFTPGSGSSVYDSGVVPAAFVQSVDLSTLTPALYLADGTSFRAYVQITETGGQTSAWAYISFTTSYLQPATPLLTAVDGTDGYGMPMVTLTVTGQDGGSTSSYVGFTMAQLTYSDDGGTTWWPVRNGSNVPLPASNQQAVVLDYEATPGYTRMYQAIVTYTS